MYQSSLDEAAKAFALENLGESDEVAKESLKEIQSFVKENPNINAPIHDLRMLMYFLRGCKFNTEQTKGRIKKLVRDWLLCELWLVDKIVALSCIYYKQRAERTEWFTSRDPFLTEMQELLSLGVFLPLRQKDADKRLIVIIRTAAHDPSKHKQNDVIKVGRMILDYLISVDETVSVYGIRAIFDMHGVSLGHALQMTPTLIKRAVNSWESSPLRIQKLEFVNANLGINVVLDIFRSFMSAKMKGRVSVRRGKPDFKATDNLPKELGGTVGSYSTLARHWKQVVEKNHRWFDEDDKFKSVIE